MTHYLNKMLTYLLRTCRKKFKRKKWDGDEYWEDRDDFINDENMNTD